METPNIFEFDQASKLLASLVPYGVPVADVGAYTNHPFAKNAVAILFILDAGQIAVVYQREEPEIKTDLGEIQTVSIGDLPGFAQ
jgi:hypothetical protein